MGLWDGSGISWTISSKMSEMNSTLSLNFYRLNALPGGQLTMKAGTNSKQNNKNNTSSNVATDEICTIMLTAFYNIND